MNPTVIHHAWHNAEKCTQCPIRHLVLFADLQQDDFKQLHIPIQDIKLMAGENLYQENEIAQNIYTIRSGLVKLVRYLPNGSYRIVRILRQGDLAGIEALSHSAYLHHAVALQPAFICRIPLENIEQINLNSPHLYKQLTARWHKVQSDADIWLTQLTIGNAKKRMANLLIYLSDLSESHYFFLPNREDIGAILAITAETASRIIAEFKRLGHLQINDQGALIHKKQLLQIA